LSVEKFLALSDDPEFFVNITVPDLDSFYWSNPPARQLAYENLGSVMGRTKDMQLSLFGTDPKYLHRAEGAGTSVAAAYAVDSSGRERAVLEVIASYIRAPYPTRCA
jgi:hypothetical protein